MNNPIINRQINFFIEKIENEIGREFLPDQKVRIKELLIETTLSIVNQVLKEVD
jgi:hypothetical protein